MKNSRFQDIFDIPDIGLILISGDGKILKKNPFTSRYLKTPRTGSYFTKLCFDDSELQKLKALPASRASTQILALRDEYQKLPALAVRLSNGCIGIVLHNSFELLSVFGAKHTADILRVIGSFAADTFENITHDITLLTRTPLFIPAKIYTCDKNHKTRLTSLPDCEVLLKNAISSTPLRCNLKTAFGFGMKNYAKFTDIAVITYLMTELVATSASFSLNGDITLDINCLGGAVVLESRGRYIRLPQKSNWINEEERRKLRFMLTEAAFAALGIEPEFHINDDTFSLKLLLPLSELPEYVKEPVYAMQASIAESIFTKLLRFIGAADTKTDFFL